MDKPSRPDISATMNSLLEMDPDRTAILTIDMQREYLDPSVGLNLLGDSEREPLVQATGQLLRAARSSGVPVIHAYVARRPQEVARGLGKSQYSSIGTMHGLTQNVAGGGTREADRLEGSSRAQVLDDFRGDDDVHVTTKKTMDAFHGTDLELLLGRAFDVTTVVVLGVNTDTCVLNTAFAATNRGYRVVVASDCTGSIRGCETHDAALSLISGSFAWVLPSHEITARLRLAVAAPATD